MRTALSRREFFAQAPASAAAATLLGGEPPPRAWIILGANWEYNDEFSYADGETAGSTLFYDQSAAEAECRRCNEDFYVNESPQEFHLDFAYCFPEGLPDGKSEEDITWDDVQAAGCWEEPFRIFELTVPGGLPHE
jgi:hypothetical protein